MSRSHVSDTTLTLGSTGTPATPLGKRRVWNRRKQEWIEVDVDTASETQDEVSTSPFAVNQGSSNAFASGVNQNSGNFLTGKPITRIHAPPGGVSTISFGGDEPETPAPTPAPAPAPVEDTTQPATPESAEEPPVSTEVVSGIDLESSSSAVPSDAPPAPPAENATEVAVAPPAPPASAVSANAYASGTNQNSGNFMTGRPTTRVRAPPGGASTLTFG
ncbi:unnamed protein product [Discosporangium mesarthrocarpum]